jgi:hypothetical protein
VFLDHPQADVDPAGLVVGPTPMAALVLEGTAGIGKTTLWQRAAELAHEHGVSRSVFEARYCGTSRTQSPSAAECGPASHAHSKQPANDPIRGLALCHHR